MGINTDPPPSEYPLQDRLARPRTYSFSFQIVA
jgi:hypothetical protein